MTMSEVITHVQALVTRGMQGDRTVLPALRALLTTRPELWTHLQTVGSRVERAWIAVLAGDDLVAQEVLTQQLQALKGELAGPNPTPLEHLLVERIAVCWLQVQQADLWAAQHVTHPTSWADHRQDRAQARFLAAVKALAQVRKLLRPQAAVQVHIAQHQVHMGEVPTRGGLTVHVRLQGAYTRLERGSQRSQEGLGECLRVCRYGEFPPA
jgi:hypothetical protein